MKKPLLLSLGFLLPFLNNDLLADLDSEAKFAVTNEIARPALKVPPLGANGGGGRAVNYAMNNMIGGGGGNEPIHWKNLHRAMNVQGKSFQLDGAGSTSWYGLWYDGFLSGATVRVYRIVDKSGQTLPLSLSMDSLDFTKADHVVLVGTSHIISAGEEGFKDGGWVVAEPPEGKQPNRVYLAADAPELAMLDYIVVDKDFPIWDMNWVGPRVRAKSGPPDRPAWYWSSKPAEVRFSLVPHPGKVPAEMVESGKTCMKVEAVAGSNLINQIRFASTDPGTESKFYGQLEPGKPYRLELWMRQEELAGNGEVHFFIYPAVDGHNDITQAFGVDGEWRKFTYDFMGPDRPRGAKLYGPAFTFTGPGTLWMDNARLFRYDKPEDTKALYVPNRTMLDELAASQPTTGLKGSHRDWVLDRDATMDSILSLYCNSRIRPDWVTSVSSAGDTTLPKELMFDYATGDGPNTRMVPHIVIQHILHDEGDWQHFIEYLAAPYDPALDTPQVKPWAYRRYVQRSGNGKPWVDEFREIIVEFGNETWQNGYIDDFLGFSTRRAIHQGGPEYGLFCTYLINNIKKSKWWAQARLDEKVHFNLGANYSGEISKNGRVGGYGELAMQKCPQAMYLGHANYVGPKWETGNKPLPEISDMGVMATLMGFQYEMKASQAKNAAARDQLNANGNNYDIISYEGGPSGYMLDPRKDPKAGEVSEQYGKSLAMAVAAFDAWMGSYLQGWTYQNYYGFAQGVKWSSHTMMSEGFRPHAGWLALTMRNRFASGDLMNVKELSGPKFSMSGKETFEIPLIGIYGMRDGNRWSIFIVSRKLNANVQGQDMGDGYNKVSIQLPFKSASGITLHKLTGDPRWTNLEEQKINIDSAPINPRQLPSSGLWNVNNATGGGAGGMPPGSIFLYVFENAK